MYFELLSTRRANSPSTVGRVFGRLSLAFCRLALGATVVAIELWEVGSIGANPATDGTFVSEGHNEVVKHISFLVQSR